MTLQSQSPVIALFGQDLRLDDNRMMQVVAESGQPVIALYVLDDETPGSWRRGGASRWWLHFSLAKLQQDLQRRYGVSLLLRRGAWRDVVPSIAATVGAAKVVFAKRYEPFYQGIADELRRRMDDTVDVQEVDDTLLFDPQSVRNKSNQPFRVFSPFWRCCLKMPAPAAPKPAPAALHIHAHATASEELADFDLLPRKPDWAGGLREHWQPGEEGALACLGSFLEGPIQGYKKGRNRPDYRSTSRLSPFLHLGNISIRRVWHEVQTQMQKQPACANDAEAFLRELGWREFSYHLLVHWPTLPELAFRPEFNAFPWQSDKPSLRAWQQGRTGFPIVDAGMRELWHTGWMHNRVRMIVASFLVKHMLIPWQAGEAWFWDTLVDADLANNAASWQWTAGCGADAAPYFRIFNPILQGEKFDPEGAYVKRWVPELKNLSTRYIHKPWEATPIELQAASVALGKSYPKPIIDHQEGRNRALHAFEMLKSARN